MLRVTGAAAGAALLAACAPPAIPKPVENTPAPAKTVASPTAAPATATPDPASLMVRPVMAEEMRKKAAWVKERLFAANPPFSFLYGGKPSGDLLATWPKKTATESLDRLRTQHTFTWTDPQTALEVRCVAVEYADYPAVEWTVWLTNAHATANTPILEAIQGLDVTFERGGDGGFTLHRWLGDSALPKSYQPSTRDLAPESSVEFAPIAGRPTNSDAFPYFDIRSGDVGWIAVVGWPGQWRARFSREGAPDPCPERSRRMRLTAGQDLTRLFLKPGERIRTPLNVLLFWQGGDVVRAQNLWRRWFMAHNLPRYGGKPVAPLAQLQLPNDEQGLFEKVKAYDAAGVHIDLCWRDAGWYPCDGDWTRTGTWEIDPKPFPHGFRPFTDWIHAQGKKMILWFEPERVRPGTWLYEQHPEWLLTFPGAENSLLNLGNPTARAWLTDHVDGLLTREGVDYYRQDFNTDPRYYWTSNDEPDRQGMIENLYVQGYLAYWDELRRRRPDMLIDSCSSGGRRNDLETLRRAVPLLRSDFQFGKTTTLGNQGHTYGISSWIPYYGTATYALGNYDARSFYVPAFGVGIDIKPEDAKRYYDECRQVAPYMLGDYYPLTPYNLDAEQWIAWQFDQPETGAGMVQAFRREKCAEAAQTFRLRGLEPTAQYTVTNFDLDAPTTISGQDLLTKGLPLEVKELPGAALVVYRRVA
jgi:alpha-galactosidase